MLADHMDFIDLLVAPLFRLGPGPEMLLLVQSLVVASAVFPLFALGRRLVRGRAGLAAAAAYLLAPDVHMGVMFDYNPSTLGSALLLWAAYAMIAGGPRRRVAFALLASRQGELHALRRHCWVSLPLLRLVSWSRGRRLWRSPCRSSRCRSESPFPMFLGRGLPALGVRGARRDARRDRGIRCASSPTAPPCCWSTTWRTSLAALAPAGHGLRGPRPSRLRCCSCCRTGGALLVDAPDTVVGLYYGMPAAAMACLGLLAGWRRLKQRGNGRRWLPALRGRLLPARRARPALHSPPTATAAATCTSSEQPNASTPDDVRTQRALVPSRRTPTRACGWPPSTTCFPTSPSARSS